MQVDAVAALPKQMPLQKHARVAAVADDGSASRPLDLEPPLREAPFPPNSSDVSDDDKSEQSELLSAKPGTQEREALEPAAEQTPGADSGQSAEAAERDRQPVVMEHQVAPVAEQMPEALAAEQMLVEAPVAEQMPEALVAEHVPGGAGPEAPVAEPGPVQGGVQRDLRQERRDANATDDSEGDDDDSHELHHRRRQAVPLLRPLRDPAVVANARRPVSPPRRRTPPRWTPELIAKSKESASTRVC